MIAKYNESESQLPTEPLLLDSEQARLMLGISARTLWSLTNAKEIPSVRLRRKVMYDLQELRGYVEQLKAQQRK